MQSAPANPADLWHLPRNAALHGSALDAHLRLNLWIALALLTLAHLILFAGLLRRRSTRPRRIALLEYLPLAALTVLFFGLAFRAQQLWAAQRYTGADPAAMQVEVSGMQFAWYFRYPGADYAFGRTRLSLADAAAGNPLGLDSTDRHATDDFVTSTLVLPANREVDLTLIAQDVIHGFSVPEMRLKQNALPGTTVHIHFTPTAPGDYAILCTQVCGLGHYRMTATMRILAQPAFDQWLHTQQTLHGGTQ
jgi:cytochrome c oxidase subunit 2